MRRLLWILVMGNFLSIPAMAQGGFQAGEVVEAHSYAWGGPTGWGKARVSQVDRSGSHSGPYLVTWEANSAQQWVGENDVRAAAGAAGAKTFAVGSRVDDYQPPVAGGKGLVLLQRGSVVAANGNSYTIHYDGCIGKDVVRDASALRPAASVNPGDASIRFLVGKWRMFQPSAPNTVVRGNTVYREYGMGAAAPPLQINSDGSYVWTQFQGQPITGKWRVDAKIQNATMGPQVQDGLVIQDERGQAWKIFRNASSQGTGDHIILRTLCSGIEMMGTRQ